MKSLKLHAVGFALFLSLLPLANSHASELSFEGKAQRAFADAITKHEIPGLIVGVTSNGKHHFYSTGVASRADNQPVTPDTIFELGSISKIFNATLAALAEQRGLLSLDEKAARYLCGGTCKVGNDMTLMDLATHRSGGLPLQVPDNVKDTDSLVDWLKEWKPPQPGTRSYSNISIGLLGHITAQAFGMSYAQAVETMLFPTLGLQNTWIEVPEKAMDQYAFGYDRKSDEAIRVTPGVLDAEAYGVKSSARDMLKLLDAELGNVTLPSEIVAAIRRTQEGQLKTTAFIQGMIWEQYPWPVDVETMNSGNGYEFILHPQAVEKLSPALSPQKNVILNKTGSTNGFGGYVAMIPGKKLGIVVLANRNFPNEARVKATYSLVEALLADPACQMKA
ncbi:class C beta-lactamase [Parapusillimonas sp. JC17]|uniref:class C beta-lactamase n=1 Tax=Parapusillimonas sp. JC17 TaxID=3445768 RepID=UPI003FA0A7D4